MSSPVAVGFRKGKKASVCLTIIMASKGYFVIISFSIVRRKAKNDNKNDSIEKKHVQFYTGRGPPYPLNSAAADDVMLHKQPRFITYMNTVDIGITPPLIVLPSRIHTTQ